MYRQYEDPSTIQEWLEEAERRLSDAIARRADVDEQIDLHNEVESLRERLNFAWQDDEYDMEGGY